ncbi:bifunctional indole-3-glycerol-phosphate synthase TrpC/phosphoribosylanthranilate isomerase TrpF [Moritella sp. Urea-trap-13]|uniref:bifunctional indole-3-glycerol-phosphate synthase TrpC/phosphoribosylanthranilate isomerase TrpF n=1 Tax=Moritella sp. Urea-trap-13 TaxID=2058327 RepID=UPI000C34B627|nr:bifunctional indole-3-glycerol-phosphate synthase TrpC/phosphoribosylanthranilate isomerase TrpF [Moritella sp. Urea-trap-13]PKH07731.1 bifunctional indole-3-glycerol-phosphate synthase TrpC/phosphoribosylanthranilate isomerase TrpF [Moritella sp. Urea-trap-13]
MLTQELQQTILGNIVDDKVTWVAARKASQPLASFIAELEPTDRDFYAALSGKPTKFILECKKASPSKGLIRPEFDLDLIAGVYKNYAAAISVLTDEKYFQGDFEYVTKVRSIVTQPVICKDFIIDEYQIYLARLHQADATLLMLSVLDDAEYIALAKVAHSLNMGVLTEVSNEAELVRAIALDAKVIGINNRDLRDLSIDLNRTKEIAPKIPSDRIIISESGIYNNQQVRDLANYANGFLVGSSLMSKDDVDLACRRLILGDNKVCGLTRPEDAKVVHEQGAIYGGLIFAPKSPRCVNLTTAQDIIAAAPLAYVGVFVDEQVTLVAQLANHLGLAAVQLHGSEDDSYIAMLRVLLDDNIQIWQAHGVSEQAAELSKELSKDLDTAKVDRHLVDTKVAGQSGGTGQAFDWSLLTPEDCSKTMLAGGLNPDNVADAAKLGCLGLDLNSGLESAPGIKDTNKIIAAFSALRNY